MGSRKDTKHVTIQSPGHENSLLSPHASEVPPVLDIYRRLYAAFGPQHWWPAASPFEVIVGAVLTQNTAWKNVERAIRHLRENGALTLEALYRIPEKNLARLIRSSGYFNLKAQRLKAVVTFIFQSYDGKLEKMFSKDRTSLRKELLSIKGLGPETVDSILLYAGALPIFVVDAYTRRIFSRHQLIEAGASYQAVQEYFMSQLPHKTQLFNEYHALIVKAAKDFCKKKPNCSKCPLNTLPGFELYRT